MVFSEADRYGCATCAEYCEHLATPSVDFKSQYYGQAGLPVATASVSPDCHSLVTASTGFHTITCSTRQIGVTVIAWPPSPWSNHLPAMSTGPGRQGSEPSARKAGRPRNLLRRDPTQSQRRSGELLPTFQAPTETPVFQHSFTCSYDTVVLEFKMPE